MQYSTVKALDLRPAPPGTAESTRGGAAASQTDSDLSLLGVLRGTAKASWKYKKKEAEN